MYLYVKRDGDTEATIYNYAPNKMMSPECEAIEKKTGLTFEEFDMKLKKGSALCRRALLWTLMKRTAPGTRFEDVQFAYGEVELRFHKEELEKMIEEVEGADPSAEKDAALSTLRSMLDEAEEGGVEGKAPSKN